MYLTWARDGRPGRGRTAGRLGQGPCELYIYIYIHIYMGKCQTDPTPKDYEMVVALRWWLGVSPAAVSAGVFVPFGRDFDQSGFIAIYFEIGGLEVKKNIEIHCSLLQYQGNLPCEDGSQKVVKSIEFS